MKALTKKHTKTQLTSRLLLQVGVIAFAIAGLTACGASKTGSTQTNSADYASRNHPGDNNNGFSKSDVLAECNSIPTNTSHIEGRLTSYYHPTTGEFYPSIIRLKIDRLPVDITTTTTHYIQMFRWYADSSGQRMYNSAPIGFDVMDRVTKQKVNSSPLKTISKAVLQNLITDHNLGGSVTLNNFFDKHILILQGMDLVYDAVSFVVYDSNQGTNFIANHDALIPAFAANPEAYAASHSASILQQLHPFWSDRGQGLSDNHFRTISMDSCIP